MSFVLGKKPHGLHPKRRGDAGVARAEENPIPPHNSAIMGPKYDCLFQ